MKRRLTLLALCALPAMSAWAQTNLNPYIQITTQPPLPAGYVGLSYLLIFQANTYLPGLQVNWTVVSGAGNGLPPGLNLDLKSGTLSGTPTAAGTFLFTIQAQLATAPFGTPPDTKNFTIVVSTPHLTITSPQGLPNALVNQSYAVMLTASANPPNVTWSTNAAPPGLTLNSNGGLSGIPTTLGTFVFTATVSIPNTSLVASQDFTLLVVAGQVVISSTPLPLAPVSQPYLATLTANPPNATWSMPSAVGIPPGIVFTAATGTFSGLPTTPGVYTMAIQADAPNYASGLRTVTIYVTNGPLGIVQTQIPIAIQNTAYVTTLTGSQGLAPYSWSLLSTAQGMAIDPAKGIISGTPTAAGAYSLLVAISDVTGAQFVRSFAFAVASPLTVQTTSLPTATLGTAYSQTLQAGGGQAPYLWSLTANSGPLPPGLALSPSGTIGGTAMGNGIYNFAVQVVDAGGRVATQALSITVGAAALMISTVLLPDATVGGTYSQSLGATGGTPPYTWSIVAGQLPAGLTLDAQSGIIAGKATTLGSQTFTVQVTDSTSGSVPLTVQKAFTLNVSLALSISNTSLPNGVVGTAYSVTLQAAGGTPPYTWSVASGSLPAGLALNPGTGAISGVPSAAGTSSFLVTATDTGGQSDQHQVSITITAAAPPPAITTGNLSATVNVAFSQTLAATGGAPPYTFALTVGTLPAGLTFANGAISGTPTTAGSSTLTFTVTDANNQTASKTITITVSLPATPAVTLSVGSSGAAQQPTVTFSLAQAFPVDIMVTFSLSFQSAVGGAAQDALLNPSGSSLTLAAGKTQLTFPNLVATGTIAGTITLTAKLFAGSSLSDNLHLAFVDITPSPAPSQTITIAKSAPVIQSVTFSNTGGSLTVTVIGYSTTREMVSGDFIFAPATGSTLSQSDITVQLGTPFATWYQSAASNPFGGQFKLTAPFTVSANATAVTSVSVKLTNTVGASPTVSPQ